MDTSKKHRIDQWVEDAVYTFLESAMSKGQITTTNAATMTPLIEMYQAIQLQNVYSELNDLWRLLADGEAMISIKTTYSGLDVNVKETPQDKPQQPKKGR